MGCLREWKTVAHDGCRFGLGPNWDAAGFRWNVQSLTNDFRENRRENAKDALGAGFDRNRIQEIRKDKNTEAQGPRRKMRNSMEFSSTSDGRHFLWNHEIPSQDSFSQTFSVSPVPLCFKGI